MLAICKSFKLILLLHMSKQMPTYCRFALLVIYSVLLYSAHPGKVFSDAFGKLACAQAVDQLLQANLN